MDYRHELKFVVSQLELEKIKYRLLPLMEKDPNITGDYYTVRSLYFDDIYDSCLNEVEAGIHARKKFRIRLYNGSWEVIHLEKKSKLRGMTRKKSETISKEICEKYMNGEFIEGNNAVSEELYCDMLRVGMKPKCIVEYDRFAYVEEIGNVRITFDMNIRGSMDTELFLESDRTDYIPALPKGMHVLEVKYDEFLPNHILQAVDLNYLQKQSLSKYVCVRNRFA